MKGKGQSGVRLLTFGKHRGKSIAQVAIQDPAYLNWIVDTFPEGSAARNAALDYIASGMLRSAGTPMRAEPRPVLDEARRARKSASKRARKNDVSETLGPGFEAALREVERLAGLGLRPEHPLDPARMSP